MKDEGWLGGDTRAAQASQRRTQTLNNSKKLTQFVKKLMNIFVNLACDHMSCNYFPRQF